MKRETLEEARKEVADIRRGNIQYQTGSDWKDWAPIDIKVNGLVEVES